MRFDATVHSKPSATRISVGTSTDTGPRNWVWQASRIFARRSAADSTPFSVACGSPPPSPNDRHAAQAAGARTAAGGGNADTGAMQHAEQTIAARGLDDLALVDGDQHRFLRHEAALGEHQADRHEDDQEDDDTAADADFDHATTISAKAEKPSDIMPARMKVMPRPLRPPGRSA